MSPGGIVNSFHPLRARGFFCTHRKTHGLHTDVAYILFRVAFALPGFDSFCVVFLAAMCARVHFVRLLLAKYNSNNLCVVCWEIFIFFRSHISSASRTGGPTMPVALCRLLYYGCAFLLCVCPFFAFYLYHLHGVCAVAFTISAMRFAVCVMFLCTAVVCTAVRKGARFPRGKMQILAPPS